MANEFGSYKGVTYPNGQVPKKFLKALDGDNHAVKGDPAVLREDAANSWNAARAAVLAKTGIVLTVRGWMRSLADQEKFFFQRYKKNAYSPWGDYRYYKGVRYGRVTGAPAAIPGTSNHGLGTTVDVNDFGAFGTDGNYRRAATIAILREYGWDTTEGDSIDEPWHLQYKDSQNKHKNDKPETAEGFLMGLSNAEQKEILDAVRELRAGTSPKIDMPWKDAKGKPEKYTKRSALKWIADQIYRMRSML